MSDQSQAPEGQEGGASTPPAQDDVVKNLKAEMNRKLDATNAQLAAVLDALKSPAKPAPSAEPQKKVSVFDDEEAYARSIEERAEARITQKLQAQQESQQKYQATIQSIIKDYPEANDESHPLTARAREIYASYSEAEKADARALRTAVLEAAAEQGMKPKHKRSESDDNFTLGGSPPAPPRRQQKDAIDPRTAEFARLMGLNMDDPKQVERLKQRTKRTNWRKYE